ncbi:MAG: PepSY domain-containing protein, partial [Solirubrobacterales bacterium]
DRGSRRLIPGRAPFHRRFIPPPYKHCATQLEEDEVKKRAKLIAIGIAALALAVGGAGVAVATGGGDDTESPISGRSLDQASAAALKATGGGTVTDTEVGDEESYYEVEVTRADGSQTDVQLDRNFNLVGQSADEESPDDGSH